MNIGLVVEGERDSAAYPELIRKIRSDIETVLTEPCGNDVRLMGKFVGWLKHFQWHAGYRVDKALVIRDSDCDDPTAWETKMKLILDKTQFIPSFPVHFHATKCELETWLLADENAINQVSIARGKRGAVSAVTVPLETHKDAKELFNKVLSKAGLLVTPEVYREIASATTIERISQRCPHFQKFVEMVRAG